MTPSGDPLYATCPYVTHAFCAPAQGEVYRERIRLATRQRDVVQVHRDEVRERAFLQPTGREPECGCARARADVEQQRPRIRGPLGVGRQQHDATQPLQTLVVLDHPDLLERIDDTLAVR